MTTHREGLAVGPPTVPFKMQPQCLLLATEEHRWLAVGPDNPEVDDLGESFGASESGGFPVAGTRLPDPDGSLGGGCSTDDVLITVAIDVQDSVARIIPGWRWKGLAVTTESRSTTQEVLGHAIVGFPEIEELDLRAVLGNGMVDQFDQLRVLTPTGWMEDEAHHALLDNRDVQGGFPVGEQSGVAVPLEVLALPVTGRQAREFPARAIDHVGVGVIADRVDEVVVRPVGVMGDVLQEPLAAIGFLDEFPGNVGVVGREDVENRGVDLQVIAGRCVAIEDLAEETRADGVERIAARHVESDGTVPGDPSEEVDTPVVGGLGPREVAGGQERAGVIDGVDFDRESFTKPTLQLWMIGADRVGHDADRCPAVYLFQPLQHRPQEGLVQAGVSHVVNGQDHDRLDTLLTDPLGCDQLGRVESHVVEGVPVEVSQLVALGGHTGSVSQQQG